MLRSIRPQNLKLMTCISVFNRLFAKFSRPRFTLPKNAQMGGFLKTKICWISDLFISGIQLLCKVPTKLKCREAAFFFPPEKNRHHAHVFFLEPFCFYSRLHLFRPLPLIHPAVPLTQCCSRPWHRSSPPPVTCSSAQISPYSASVICL